jgi:hypothetical protein
MALARAGHKKLKCTLKNTESFINGGFLPQAQHIHPPNEALNLFSRGLFMTAASRAVRGGHCTRELQLRAEAGWCKTSNQL